MTRWDRWDRELAQRHRWRFGFYRGLVYALIGTAMYAALDQIDHRYSGVQLLWYGAVILVSATFGWATVGRWRLLRRLDDQEDPGRPRRPGPFDPFS